MSTSKAANQTQSKLLTFNWWWVLAGCVIPTLLIVIFGPYSADIEFAPDQGRLWYYWQLAEPTFLSRFLAWSGYFAHQVSIWYLIYIATQERPRYSSRLHKFNIMALGVNGFFILVHIFQTKLTYDGLAQDTDIRSSFWGVAIMVFLIFILENKNRGMFFGKTINTFDSATDFLKKYHGYYFSWAIVYTFWYHPVEDTIGHLAGNFYTFMLLIQGSLFFTRFHTNKYWRVLLEVSFSIHGAMVAYIMKENDDFGAVLLLTCVGAFAVTQMYGLGLGKIQRWLIITLTVIGIVGYGFLDPERAFMPTLQLIGRYAIIFVFAFIIWLLIRGFNSLNQRDQRLTS